MGDLRCVVFLAVSAVCEGEAAFLFHGLVVLLALDEVIANPNELTDTQATARED